MGVSITLTRESGLFALPRGPPLLPLVILGKYQEWRFEKRISLPAFRSNKPLIRSTVVLAEELQ